MIIPTVTKRRLAEGTEGEHMAANVTVFIHYEWEAIKIYKNRLMHHYFSLYLRTKGIKILHLFLLCVLNKKKTT